MSFPSLQALQIKKDERELIRDFGYSEKEFISQAMQDRLMELRKLLFFSISEKIRKGLKKKGLTPKDVLSEIKS